MTNVGRTLDLVLKALAVGMAVAVVVLGALEATSVETLVSLLGIGLFALSVAGLRGRSEAVADRP
jgi:hypothetical protein